MMFRTFEAVENAAREGARVGVLPGYADVDVQARILAGYANFTRPGGKLVYATCSILPDENERQVRAFLAAHGDVWTLEEELQLRPDRAGFDGFYAARLGRKA